MSEDHSGDRITAFECDVLRSAFRKSVIEEKIPEDRWHGHALNLVRELTNQSHIGSDVLDWIVRK